jgi:hypothetical protein
VFDAIWHDPVGSAAIGGLIVVAVAAFASWFWRGLREKGPAPTVPQMIVRILLIALPIAIVLWFTEKLGEWSATHPGPHVLHTITSVGLPLLLGLMVALAVLQRPRGQPAAQPEGQPKVDPKVEEAAGIGSVDPQPAPTPAEAQVPSDFQPTKRQMAAAAILQRTFPTRCDLQDVYSAMMQNDYTLLRSGVTKAEIADDLEALAAAHIVRIESLTHNFAYYHLTKPGRTWLNERSARQRGRPAPERPGDY